MSISNDDVEIGQHCWALLDSKLLVVVKESELCYGVCGGWECMVANDELEIIEIIPHPTGHEETELYYIK